MNFERTLTEEEILTALEKGSKKAAKFLERNEQEPSFLIQAYKSVLKIIDRTEEHFSIKGYSEKNVRYAKKNKPLTESNIRGLFLCAVEAVQCLEEIEPHLQKSTDSLMDEAISLDRRVKLVRGATVFRTDGHSDFPALDVERLIQKYRHEQLNAA